MKDLIRTLMMITIAAVTLGHDQPNALASSPVPMLTVAPTATVAATRPLQTQSPLRTATKVSEPVTSTAQPVTASVTPTVIVPTLSVTPATPASMAATTIPRTNTPVLSRPGTPTSSSVTIGPTNLGTPVASPVSPMAMQVLGISPPNARNELDTAVSISGTGFVEGMTLTIGGQSLTNVRVGSNTLLAATIPAGLCPGTYPVAVTAPTGRSLTSGAHIVLRGRRLVSMEEEMAAEAALQRLRIWLGGKDQRQMVPIAPITVDDTTCSKDAIQVMVTVSRFEQVGRSGSLAPLSIEVTVPEAAHVVRAPFDRTTGDSQVTLTIPATGRPGITRLNAKVELLIPANAYAGEYHTTASAANAAAP